MQSTQKEILEISSKGVQIKIAINVSRRLDQWIVGLHGIQSNKDLFEGLFSQDQLSDYSRLAIDFVGFGESDKPEGFSYRLEDQAEIVIKVIDKLGINKLHLIGHSLGGMVGTLLLKQISDKLLSFSNLEGNLVYTDCGASREVAELSRKEFVDTGYIKLQNKIENSHEPSSEQRAHWLRLITATVFYDTSVSIVEWSKSEKLKEIYNNSSVKRLFMFGSKSVYKPSIVSDVIKKIEVPEAGHFMLLDNPEYCYEALSDFIVGV